MVCDDLDSWEISAGSKNSSFGKSKMAPITIRLHFSPFNASFVFVMAFLSSKEVTRCLLDVSSRPS